MFTDRRAAKWLNGFCVFFAIAAVAAIGLAVLTQKRAAEPYLAQNLPPARLNLREARHAAMLAERNEDAAEAVRQYHTVLSLRPYLREAQLGLARTLAASGKRREAWDLYRRIVDIKLVGRQRGPDADTLAWYADLAAEFGSRAEAEQAARAAGGPTPLEGSPKGNKLLAMAHVRATSDRSGVGSLDHAKRALQLDPSSIVARLRIALLRFDHKQEAQANAELAKSVPLIESGPWDGWLALADFWNEEREPEKVRDAFQEAFRRCPSSDARGLMRLFRAASALPLGPGLVPVGTSDPVIHGLAEKAFDEALRAVKPDDWETLTEIAETLQQRRDLKRAEPLAVQAMKVANPEDTSSCLRLARVLSACEKKAEAKAVLDRARQVASPKETSRYRSLAVSYISIDQKGIAKAMLQAALRFAIPDDRENLNTWLQEAEGRPKPAPRMVGGFGPALAR
jgi:tetratricopeptide (TPR) repeat protein